jgi:hypothetical protein
VLVGLASLGVACAAFVAPRSLVASTPSSPPAEDGQSTGTQTALDGADGVIRDGEAASVFDEEIPAVATSTRISSPLAEEPLAVRVSLRSPGAPPIGHNVSL